MIEEMFCDSGNQSSESRNILGGTDIIGVQILEHSMEAQVGNTNTKTK